MTYRKGIAEFRGESADTRFYIFDPRHPVTDRCHSYYVKTGARYDVFTGRVKAAPASKDTEVFTLLGHMGV